MKNICFFLMAMITVGQLTAQRKSELIAQNQELKYQLDSIKRTISDAQKAARIATTRSEEMQAQVTELQDANATLMKNLNSFATLSSQNSKNINKTLATLKRKEAQISTIINAGSSHDSTAVVALTHTKKTLGENANVQVVSGGEIIISEKVDFFFDNGMGSQLLEAAKPWIGKVAQILNANPNTHVTVAGLSMTGELDIALQQAAAVAAALIKEHGISGDRVHAKGADGGLREGVQVRIHPDYKGFYAKARDDVKE
ncbi:hypothetical protein [Maribacter sp. 2307ULW6-5]|uniref:hypothetical protein n=1 Tax=Maribacter sp. 2307ULW6-5 TaxID=3386275 RepID=UPI0039BCA90C